MLNNAFGELSQALNQARIFFKQRKLDQALGQTNEILKVFPDDIRVNLLKGVIQRRRGFSAEACEILGRVVLQVPELTAVQMELRLALYTNRRLKEAKGHLLRSVQLDNSLAVAWNKLGEIYMVDGDRDKAEEAFGNQLVASKKHPGLVKAIELVVDRKLGMAEGIFWEYLKRFPTDVTAIRLLAEIGLKLRIFDEARTLLERRLELAPDCHLARNTYANVLSKVHKFDEAIQRS